MTAEERLQQSIQTLSQAGLDPAKLKNWQGASNSTPECLSLPELRKLPYIAEERQDHVEGCEFCQFMLKVLLPEQASSSGGVDGVDLDRPGFYLFLS